VCDKLAGLKIFFAQSGPREVIDGTKIYFSEFGVKYLIFGATYLSLGAYILFLALNI